LLCKDVSYQSGMPSLRMDRKVILAHRLHRGLGAETKSLPQTASLFELGATGEAGINLILYLGV
jgi:hypothetical protein